jgi:hypothetical protein
MSYTWKSAWTDTRPRPSSVYARRMVKTGSLFAIALLGAGCVSTTTVAGPDGSEDELVRCSDSADCYDKAREVCGGPYQIMDSGNRGAVGAANGTMWSSSWHEVLVHCGSAPSAAPPPAPVAQNQEPKPSESAPNQGAGFSLGASLDETKSVCEAASLEWKQAGQSYRCSGTPVDTGMHAGARLSFCDAELCRIDIVVPPSEGASIADNVTRTLSTLAKRYGDATEHDVVYGASCTGEALPDCLERGSAHFFYQWRWAGGKKLTLLLGSRTPPSSDVPGSASVLATMHIRYDDGRFVKRKSGAAKSSADAPQTAEVEGL